MALLPILSILTIFVVSDIAAMSLNDPCNINIWNSLSSADTIYNASCSSGHIYWNYPQGRIRVALPDNVCIRQGGGSAYVSVFQETEGGRRELTFNNRGTACVTSDGGVTVMIEGPRRTMSYMALFSYEVQGRPDRSLQDRLRGILNHVTTEVSRSIHNLLQSWRIRFNFAKH